MCYSRKVFISVPPVRTLRTLLNAKLPVTFTRWFGLIVRIIRDISFRTLPWTSNLLTTSKNSGMKNKVRF